MSGFQRRMVGLEFLQIGLRLKIAKRGGIGMAVLLQRVRLENLVVNIQILFVRPGGQGRAVKTNILPELRSISYSPV